MSSPARFEAVDGVGRITLARRERSRPSTCPQPTHSVSRSLGRFGRGPPCYFSDLAGGSARAGM